MFALASRLAANAYSGLLLGTVVFSVGCGLLEVLLSPIRNAVPSEHKAADMALLHAFYPIGKVVVIILTALALQWIGTRHWRAIVLAWSLIPLANTLAFSMVRLPLFAPEGQRQTLRALVRRPAYLWLLAALLTAGAAEVTVAQWTSAFAEMGLGVSKLVADLVGFTLFGVGMIVGRLWFGIKGEQGDPWRLMLAGSLLTAATYLVMSLSPWPLLSLAVCAPAGLFVRCCGPGRCHGPGALTFGRGSMFACWPPRRYRCGGDALGRGDHRGPRVRRSALAGRPIGSGVIARPIGPARGPVGGHCGPVGHGCDADRLPSHASRVRHGRDGRVRTGLDVKHLRACGSLKSSLRCPDTVLRGGVQALWIWLNSVTDGSELCPTQLALQQILS